MEGMVSLEMIGISAIKTDASIIRFHFYSGFPKKGNFLSFVGDIGSRKFTQKIKGIPKIIVPAC